MRIFSSLESLKGKRIHFVGIKGTGCAAFAEILTTSGARVSGSDVNEIFYTDTVLKQIGITPLTFDSKNITADIELVIHSSAYNEENEEIARAKELKIPTILYTEALGLYSALHTSVGVSGVHGKTSTTALIGTILKALPLKAQVLAGSLVKTFSESGKDSCTFTSAAFGQGGEEKFFVAETCEYKRHFMSFRPSFIILTSVESDHQDFYPTLASIRNAFIDYVCLLPQGGTLLYCADDEGAVFVARKAAEMRSDLSLVPYGETAKGRFQIKFLPIEGGFNRFRMEEVGEVKLRLPGRHMASNAACAVALAALLLEKERLSIKSYASSVKEALAHFPGLKRRSEVLLNRSVEGGASLVVMDDYAHHPTAIRATLSGLREFYEGYAIIADFMSHTYSRTLALFDEFAGSFDDADVLILNKIYASARENHADYEDAAHKLFLLTEKNHAGKTFYFPEPLDAFEQAVKEIKALTKDGRAVLFVTLGAGDNWKLSYKIAQYFASASE